MRVATHCCTTQGSQQTAAWLCRAGRRGCIMDSFLDDQHLIVDTNVYINNQILLLRDSS